MHHRDFASRMACSSSQLDPPTSRSTDRISRAHEDNDEVDPAHGRGRGVAAKSPQLMKIVNDDVRVEVDAIWSQLSMEIGAAETLNPARVLSHRRR